MSDVLAVDAVGHHGSIAALRERAPEQAHEIRTGTTSVPPQSPP
ncbi:hypothetical protein ACWT_4385 [Actinoplanes sp. SE50]|nr:MULTISPECIES: hypothetical protein [unclassified Actinoplanes]AEV85405.1 hypothetical protein ACPL_4514 [Actinoplanes sp. SE50/110]ATO83800.1 hypothetical protein ACWT_4385 [Actinoplanes sp. SE50]SLM01208.1 hypothetical protein ACSP50_4444 [Actinoplanes sp. SE50/110]